MTTGPPGHPQIAFLLGKPLGSGSVLADVIEHVHRWCPTIMLHRPIGDAALPGWLFESDLVVQRGINQRALDTISSLEEAGVRICNRIAATRRCANRASVLSSLAVAGVRVPATSVAVSWREVQARTDGQAIVVKEADGIIGRGLHVLVARDGMVPLHPPFPGPYAIQEYIPNDGHVYKLYVVGRRVRGLLKDVSPIAGAVTLGTFFEIDPTLKKVARLVGQSAGLEIFGVDVLVGEAGPVIIDVNPFPGFRGVPDAARLISDYLATSVDNG